MRRPSLLHAACCAALLTAALIVSPVRTATATEAEAVARSTSSAYLFVQSQDHSKPVQWLDCKPIDFQINLASAPSGMTAVIKHVFATISEQTGATFHYAGRTTRVYGATSHSQTTPTIYISFSNTRAAHGVQFAKGGVVGWGGPVVSSMWVGDSSLEAVTLGDVILFSGYRAAKYGTGASWESLIMHEVGHALNLAHRSSPKAIMYPELLDEAPDRFSAPEVKALKQVLQRSTCDYAGFAQLG